MRNIWRYGWFGGKIKDDEKIWDEKKMNMKENFCIGNLFDKLKGKDSEKKYPELENQKEVE